MLLSVWHVAQASQRKSLDLALHDVTPHHPLSYTLTQTNSNTFNSLYTLHSATGSAFLFLELTATRLPELACRSCFPGNALWTLRLDEASVSLTPGDGLNSLKQKSHLIHLCIPSARQRTKSACLWKQWMNESWMLY